MGKHADVVIVGAGLAGLSCARRRLVSTSLGEIFAAPERSTREALEAEGFTPTMIERFFRPFLGGIFLDRDLETTSRMWEFVFKMFSEGEAALPAGGMERIPQQLAEAIPAVSWRSTVCVYYAAASPPTTVPILLLNGEGRGPINNLCVPSRVATGYAPSGQDLVSVTVVNPMHPDGAERAVRNQLREWFGAEVDTWTHLHSMHVPRALPAQPSGWLEPPERSVRLEQGLYLCGDHRSTASIQGAMTSGRRAADALLADRS